MREGRRGRHRHGTDGRMKGQGQVGEGRPDIMGADKSREGRN